jgi:hypothetical protein
MQACMRKLLFVLRRLRTFFERLAVPDPALTGVAGQFEILCKFESVDRARIFTQAAEHATAEVVGEIGEFFAPCLLVACARNYDQILRACQRAQIAGNTHGFVGIGIHVQARRAPVSLGNLRPLQGILLSVGFLRVLIAERDLQSLQKVDEKNLTHQRGHPHMRVAYHLQLPVTSGRLAGRLTKRGNFVTGFIVSKTIEDIMRAYLANLTSTAKLLLALPILAIAYPVVTIVVPDIIRAVVPEAVRSVLSLI